MEFGNDEPIQSACRDGHYDVGGRRLIEVGEDTPPAPQTAPKPRKVARGRVKHAIGATPP